ncbi:UDP-N-acetyl glucosamine 2-epimerase [Luminiphilus sp.]|nr:UDP-N-acetyl glucosamine 2-epimerase [Luminiphilus sp.]MDB2352871.1 UDP-N-acetyl glucosamine 2-epimerase [Luminiphilus sp.]
MKVLTVIGARPQFIKAAAVSRITKNRDGLDEVIVHTGQHYDNNMSSVFFDQLEIPKPRYNLEVAGLSHGAMTGKMLEGIERTIKKEAPDWVLVYGDTNSTLAATLASVKCHVPVAHVEAGLRSHNPLMPEEINRVLTDRCSSVLFCPTDTASRNLRIEGFPFAATVPTDKATPMDGERMSAAVGLQSVLNVGDVMYDAVSFCRSHAINAFDLQSIGAEAGQYAICTIHRQENTDSKRNLQEIFAALVEISREVPVFIPVHPRTRRRLEDNGIKETLGLRFMEPLPYFELQSLLARAAFVLTDSGGLQKEAFFHHVPCITLREETEWAETVDSGWNSLAGADKPKILQQVQELAQRKPLKDVNYYGDGKASEKIVDTLVRLS